MKNSSNKISEEAKQLAVKIPKTSKIIKGSPVYLFRKCGKTGCRCADGEKHKSLYLSRSVNGKTQMTYIPHQYEKMVLSYVNKYKEIITMLDKISECNLQIIKTQRSEAK